MVLGLPRGGGDLDRESDRSVTPFITVILRFVCRIFRLSERMIEAGNLDRAINPLSCSVPIDMVCCRRSISGKIYPPGLS